jgi:hypothetical protein
MKASKAIEILKKQKESLKDINVQTYEAWRHQTASYIKMFLGQTNEYVYIKDLGIIGHYPESYDYGKRIKEVSVSLNSLLDNCIETIKQTGLVKKEWKHILITTHPAVFWSVFVAIVGLSFWLGTLIHNPANKSDKTPNKDAENKNGSVVDTTHK